MCVTVPCKVIGVTPGRAEVLYTGQPRWVAVAGIPDLAVGEYVTVYAGAVLDRMPTDMAEELIALFGELADMQEAEV